MSTPRTTEGISIRVVPLAVFCLILLAPFLNFEFALYRSTLKLFVYQTAATLVWGYLAWTWATGGFHRQDASATTGWPAWWLFAPVAAWVVWGAATAAWSPQGWLASGWVVQGLYGAAGALGLALLLRDAGHRRVFVAAASAVAFALAFLMVLYYGDPRAKFLGDIDHLDGREAGAAFLLLPTLAAAALLYRRAREEGEGGYRRVVWLAALLAVFLVAGVRTGMPAWRYGLGIGLAVLVWLMLPRWHLAAAALAAVVALAAAQREVKQGLMVADYTDPSGTVRRAVLDAAERGLVRHAPLGRLLVGNGVGTFRLDLDLHRPPWTYAVSYGDEAVGHARRQVTEELIERGLVGLGIAVAMGLAWVVAGVLAFRRARDSSDAALGAGLAAAGIALGVFACFSNGAIGFGSAMVFWIGLGVLGALSSECGRPAGLSWSPEEEDSRDEARPRVRKGRALAASALVIGLAVAWLALAVRPLWAEYCIREGQAEDDTTQRLYAQKKVADQTLTHRRAMAKQAAKDLDAQVRAADEALAAAAAAQDEALKGGVEKPKADELAAKRQAAAAELAKLRTAANRAKTELQAAVRQVEETLRSTSQDYEDSARRTDGYLRRASRLSLGDRVWLAAQLRRALSDAACDKLEDAVRRLEFIEARCGPALDLDIKRADCYVKMAHRARAEGAQSGRQDLLAEAHRLFRRYAAKNPFGASCAIFTARVPFYEDWSDLITEQRRRKSPLAAAWAKDFVAATSEGLLWLPRHYGLLLLRGGMLYFEGDKPQARSDMMAASAIIEDALGQVAVPLVRARLWFELASANTLWDKEKAVKAAKQVVLERLDFRDPQTQKVILMAHQIIRRLEPPKEKEKGPKPPDTKAPAPPKDKGEARQGAPEVPKNTSPPARE